VEFRWNNWNSDHVGRHGVLPEEAEAVVRHARRPYPQARADEKWLVRGQNSAGRWLQVVFVFSPDDTVFVIHARPLTESEKRRERRLRS